ncbi:MAG: M20/M25/M40 family metallo-hydrolase [Planctomycetota bacterium]|nr:M20/M25/M40 family metallo-hydrolase [Planctomycetota bacterium]
MTAEPDILQILDRLVAHDTTSAHHRPTTPLGDEVCELLDRPGIRVERFDCGGGRENLWFETGPAPDPDGRGLLLCGHVDVVPATEPEWTGDPFRLRIVPNGSDEHAVGRGVCDMKGFDAIAISMMMEAAATGGLDEPLCLLLTCDEEIGTVGAGHFATQWGDRPIPRRTIVGEPTSLRPIRGHKGHLSIAIEVGGRGCHTGFPERGVNAIERSIHVLEALRDLRAELVDERTEASGLFPETPFPVLTIATARAGSAVNVMPDRMSLRVGVRLLPGQSASSFLPRMVSAIEAHGVEVDLRDGLENDPPGEDEPLDHGDCLLVPMNDTPSYAIESDHPFLAEVRGLVDDDEELGANFGTDAGRLEPLGCHSVVFGPGDISVAHRPDELISIAELRRARGLLADLVR